MTIHLIKRFSKSASKSARLKQLKSETSQILFILLVMIIILCGISIQLSDKINNNKFKKDQASILAEQIYRNQLREFLNQAGYRDSGINMTSTVTQPTSTGSDKEANELREYQVSIYHKKISSLSEPAASELLTDLVMIEVPMEDCKVSHKFIK